MPDEEKDKFEKARAEFMKVISRHVPPIVTIGGVLVLIEFYKYADWKIRSENPKEENRKPE